MYDFFTELDSDLQNTSGTNAISKNKTPVIKQFTPSIVADTTGVAPFQEIKNQKTHTIPQEKKIHAIHEKQGSNEDMNTQKVTNNSSQNVFPRTKSQVFPILGKGYTRIIAVGGCNEVGKNLTVIQYAEEFFIIGGGIGFPEDTDFGAKYSIPDITPLFAIKKKIVGIIVMNGHLGQIGGLKHILPALGYPKIYGTKLTIGIIKREMEATGMLEDLRFQIINPDTDGMLQISENIKIELFRQSNNIPDAVGAYIETPRTKLVHTGDYKFDANPSIVNAPNFVKLRQIGARGIDLLMSDSTHAMKEGLSKTESEIGSELHEIISKATGRIILSVSSNHIGRIRQIIESGEKLGRTVFLSGRNLSESIHMSRETGYIGYRSQSVQRLTNQIDTVSQNRQIILVAESQKKEVSELHQMAKENHPFVQVHPGDTIVFSPNSAANNSGGITELMNAFIRLGAMLFTKESMDIQESGHAAKEEQKTLISLIHPRNLMPVQGELFMRVSHKQTAVDMGFRDKNIFLLDNGSLLDIDQNGMITKNTYKFQTEEMVVDGNGIGIRTSHVTDARMQMMQSGVVTLVFKADEKTKTLLGHLKLETRGLVYLDEVREVHKMIIKKARASYEDTMKDIPDIEEKDLIKIIRRDMEIFLQYRIERNPVIIPIIMYV